MSTETVRWPDLSSRPYELSVERLMSASPAMLYRAWTEQFDLWFAAPGSVLMKAEVNTPFFFETEFQGRSPHYGRFLRLIQDQQVALTWVTGVGGTEGAETVVSVEFNAEGDQTRLQLGHSGFLTEQARDQHQLAWPLVLEQLDQRLSSKV